MSTSELFERLLLMMLPAGGYVMGLVEVYFDESQSDEEQILCLAGYVFRKERAIELQSKWESVLKEYDVPIFHMVDCAHGTKNFANLSKNKRVALQIKLFDLLKEHMECGFAVTFDLRYAYLCPSARSSNIEKLSPYGLCCYWCLMHARGWANRDGGEMEIAYFFEAGHNNEREASKIVSDTFSEPKNCELYRYAGHAFIPKTKAVLLQTADILAWHWRKHLADKKNGKPGMRKDLLSLLDKPHFTTNFDKRTIKQFLAVVRKDDPSTAKPLVFYQVQLNSGVPRLIS